MIRNPFDCSDPNKKKMLIYTKMRKDLIQDWAYLTDDIQDLSQRLDWLLEKEQIKLMRKWVKVI